LRNASVSATWGNHIGDELAVGRRDQNVRVRLEYRLWAIGVEAGGETKRLRYVIEFFLHASGVGEFSEILAGGEKFGSPVALSGNTIVAVDRFPDRAGRLPRGCGCDQ